MAGDADMVFVLEMQLDELPANDAVGQHPPEIIIDDQPTPPPESISDDSEEDDSEDSDESDDTPSEVEVEPRRKAPRNHGAPINTNADYNADILPTLFVEAAIPPSFVDTFVDRPLLPFQTSYVRWMQECSAERPDSPWPHSHGAPHCKIIPCGGGLFLSPGSGKTVITVAYLRLSEPMQTLIVVDPATIDQWMEELAAQGLHAEAIRPGHRLTRTTPIAQIVVLTHVMMRTMFSRAADELAKKYPPAMLTPKCLIVDEAHGLGGAGVKATARIPANIRWVLTGTPVGKDYQTDMGALYDILNPGAGALDKDKIIFSIPALKEFARYAKREYYVPLPPQQFARVLVQPTTEERQWFERIRAAIRGEMRSATPSSGRINLLFTTLRRAYCALALVARMPDLNLPAAKVIVKPEKFTGKATANMRKLVPQILADGCPVCYDAPATDPVAAPCGHLACTLCMTMLFGGNRESPCPMCRAVFRKDQAALVSSFLTDISEEKEIEAIQAVGDLVVPAGKSSKHLATVALVQKLLADDPTSCIIVFSCWSGWLRMLAPDFGESAVLFDGSVPIGQRLENIKTFHANGRRVLLLSARAGGRGLNLTQANHVVMTDPWGQFAEQAVARALRIGQTREVTVHVLTTQGEVEEAFYGDVENFRVRETTARALQDLFPLE